MVDVSAYVPRHVTSSPMPSPDAAGHYVHISSISAYDEAAIDPSEDSPLNADLVEPTEEVTGETYGPLKAMCERVGRERFGEDRTSVIRPTYVAGPHDSTDRFTYWARRMARGGDVAIVGSGAPLQIVDARDLGQFIVRCAESRAAGAFDAVGPWAPIEEFLATITPDGVEASFIDVGGAALEAAGVPAAAAVGRLRAQRVHDPARRSRPRRRLDELGRSRRPATRHELGTVSAANPS